MVVSIHFDMREMMMASKWAQRAIHEFGLGGRDIMIEWGKRVKQYARENASKRIYPKRYDISEDLSNGIHRKTYAKEVRVTAQASYAGMMETGTRPHDIPNNPLWGLVGKKHPGAQGYPIQHFMSRAFNRGVNELKEIAKSKIDSRLNKLRTTR